MDPISSVSGAAATQVGQNAPLRPAVGAPGGESASQVASSSVVATSTQSTTIASATTSGMMPGQGASGSDQGDMLQLMIALLILSVLLGEGSGQDAASMMLLAALGSGSDTESSSFLYTSSQTSTLLTQGGAGATPTAQLVDPQAQANQVGSVLDTVA
ncbi:MAG TPA: hypothetical protein VGC81_02145 [Candidatus Methylomirabilis sp.]